MFNPRIIEIFFIQIIDYLKDKIQLKFEYHNVKCDYIEFKIYMYDLIKEALKMPKDGWMMQEGMPWLRHKKSN